jgi:drug/metabolite transporter (DMT)-like permease
MPGGRAAPRSALATRSLLAAAFGGLMYSLYSLIDKIGVGRLHINPPVYIYLTYTFAALLVLLWVCGRHGGATLRAEWQANGRACMTVGILNLFTYLLVLYAMSLPGTPVSYITPLRTTSVLIGVLLGVGVLGEGRLAAKFGAALLMMAGIALMAWKG